MKSEKVSFEESIVTVVEEYQGHFDSLYLMTNKIDWAFVHFCDILCVRKSHLAFRVSGRLNAVFFKLPPYLPSVISAERSDRLDQILTAS